MLHVQLVYRTWWLGCGRRQFLDALETERLRLMEAAMQKTLEQTRDVSPRLNFDALRIHGCRLPPLRAGLRKTQEEES